MIIKTIVIEDESKSRSMLVNMIQKVNSNLQIVGEAISVNDGIEKIKALKPDLVFLDVSMPDGTGFDLLEKVQGQKFELIFATASDQYAIKAIKYSACDYLLKPIDIEELKSAIDKVISKKNESPNMDNLNFLIQHLKKSDDNFQKITLPTGNAYEIVAIKDIIRCEADASYTTFYLVDKRKILVSLGLKHYEELLPTNDFIRVHHQHLINMNHVIRYLKEDGGYAIMVDGSKIELSRRKKDHFLEKLSNK